MKKKEPKPRKLRWDGKPAFCVWDGIGVGLTVALFVFAMWFFLMLAGIIPNHGGEEQLYAMGMVATVLVVGTFVYFLTRWKRMLTVTSGFLMTSVILCMLVALYFVVVAGASIFPFIYQKIYYG